MKFSSWVVAAVVLTSSLAVAGDRSTAAVAPEGTSATSKAKVTKVRVKTAPAPSSTSEKTTSGDAENTAGLGGLGTRGRAAGKVDAK